MTCYHFEHTSFSLLVLNFSYNDMTCLYMEAFHNFKYINTISFFHNAMYGSCSHPRRISDKNCKLSIIYVIISFNKLTVITSKDIKILSDLQYIDISSNPLHLADKNVSIFIKYWFINSTNIWLVLFKTWSYTVCCGTSQCQLQWWMSSQNAVISSGHNGLDFIF